MNRPSAGTVTAGVVVLAASALALGPVLARRGVVLVADMSFVPGQPWKPSWLGLDGSVPRAVPADAVVWLLGLAVPGDLLQKAILLGLLVGAGLGMLRLLGRLHPAAATAAAVLYLWNPYVFERLAIGHWGLMLGYAAVPWVMVAALGIRRRGLTRPGLAALTLALGVAALGSPSGAVLAAVVALTLGPRRWREAAAVLGAALVVSLPWIVPGLLASTTTSDPDGVAAFAARPDTPWTTLGSLLTFGGIWKESAAPAERAGWLLSGLALAVSVAALVMLARRAWRHRQEPVGDRYAAGRLLLLAAIALALSGISSTALGADALAWIVDHVPGAGLLRDAQKWVAPLAAVVAVGAGLLLDAAVRRLRRAELPAGWIWAAVLVPVLLLPSLAWGLAGRYRAVEYPAEWAAVSELLADRGAADGRTVVLPWSAYQRYPWNDRRAVLDPAIRYFPGEVVTSDDLVLADDSVVTGDGALAARVGAALASPDVTAALRDEGVSWVVVERGSPSAGPLPEVRGRVLHDGPELRVIELGDPVPAPVGRARAGAVLAADGVALIALVSALVMARPRDPRPRRRDQVRSGSGALDNDR